MLARYVWTDLVRNPRRTFSSMVGVVLGVGLSCSILFFVDGLSASMTQRAVAPVAIDVQRVLSVPIGGDLRLTQNVTPASRVARGGIVRVRLTVRNVGRVTSNDVVVRSEPARGMTFEVGSATRDGTPIPGSGSPFSAAADGAGLDLGPLKAGATSTLEYRTRSTTWVNHRATQPRSTVSSREAVTPVLAGAPAPVALSRLASDIARIEGVAFADQLSFVDLPSRALATGGRTALGPARIFGFDSGYARRSSAIAVTKGSMAPGRALLSAEAATDLHARIGDVVSFALPDGSRANVVINGIVDLSRARPLFISRMGVDFETFHYVRSSVVLDSATFDRIVMPAYDRAAARRGDRVKSPPVREVDIGVRRNLLNADPATALGQTRRIATEVSAVGHQNGFALDNISNTLGVAKADASVAKRLFVFLGAPAVVLAALLAAYAGSVLADAQRRDQETLRTRGASRTDLRRMLALRVGGITAAGSIVGLALGYGAATIVIGHASLAAASTVSLVASGLLGTGTGLVAAGACLYITARKAVDRVVDGESAATTSRLPLWRRYRLDLVAALLVTIVTAVVISTSASKGTAGSVYVGRAVKLSLALLVLPIAAWLAGGLLAGRFVAWILGRHRAARTTTVGATLPFLYRTSRRRRSRALAQAAAVLAMIVALTTSLTIFTASYDAAKSADARYVIGSDIRIVPSPATRQRYRSTDGAKLKVAGVKAVTPVVYGINNVIVRSKRTSDPANLAAIDPRAYERLAPLTDSQFVTKPAHESMAMLADQPNALLMSSTMADFLQLDIGSPVVVLLARGTDRQVETKLQLVGLYDRLPGFPDGVQAVMNLSRHEAVLPATTPDFFLAQTTDGSDRTLRHAIANLQSGPAAGHRLTIETRATAVASDQSTLAALNLRGLVELDTTFALAMSIVTIAIFVFGLLLQRRREYVTLRAQGLQPRAIRLLIGAEAATVAVAGCITGVAAGLVMAVYLIRVLRPLFLHTPAYMVPLGSMANVVGSVMLATALTSLAASSIVNRLRATELLRDE